MLRWAGAHASLPTMGSSSDESVRARFGRLVADAARGAGYDIDGRGGKAALARAIDMDPSNVGRMLDGRSLPDVRFFERIAAAVRLDVRDLLIEAEIVSPQSLGSLSESGASQVRSRSITPAEAAEELGIFDPVAREMFLGTVERLRRIQGNDRADDDRGGAAAEM